MKPIECRFEEDVLMYVGTGRWPDRAPAEVTAHAATCEICRDLANERMVSISHPTPA